MALHEPIEPQAADMTLPAENPSICAIISAAEPTIQAFNNAIFVAGAVPTAGAKRKAADVALSKVCSQNCYKQRVAE